MSVFHGVDADYPYTGAQMNEPRFNIGQPVTIAPDHDLLYRVIGLTKHNYGWLYSIACDDDLNDVPESVLAPVVLSKACVKEMLEIVK